MMNKAAKLPEQATKTTKKNLIKRLLQACVREDLLPFALKENLLIISLKNSKKTLIANNVQQFNLRKFKIDGEIIIVDRERFHILTDVGTLLKIIHQEIGHYIDNRQWKKFVAEIDNCNANDFLASRYQDRFNGKLIHEVTKAEYQTLIEYIESTHNTAQQLIFFERWAAKGHPYHPCHKTKLGFSTKAYLKYSPEFNRDIMLPLAAVSQALMHVEGDFKDITYNQWFAKQFPTLWVNFCEKLSTRGLRDEDYYPIFIHPWQYESVIPLFFGDHVKNQNLILFKDLHVVTKASLSFRTLIIKDSDQHPHIKLPVAVHSTSALRTISPASIQNSPKLGRCIRSILQLENNFDQTLCVAIEQCGLHIKHPNPDIAKYFGILYRENPGQFLRGDQTPIVVAALFEQSPISQLPLFIEILQLAVGSSKERAINYFDTYCQIVIRSYLDLFLIYGIALEGHQQNTIAVFKQHHPVMMIARDLGGLRIHASTLQQRGFGFQAYPNSATVTQHAQEVTNKFLHTVIQYHLGEMILMLAQHYQIHESVLWRVIRNNLNNRFLALKEKVDSARWQREYAAIFENDWQIKGLMRMRLSNVYSQYIYIDLKNPLRDI